MQGIDGSPPAADDHEVVAFAIVHLAVASGSAG